MFLSPWNTTPPRGDIRQLTEDLLDVNVNQEVRKEAALQLGSYGTNECLEPVVKALDDDDDFLRSYAMMGIGRGIDAKRCTEEFLDGVFPALTKLLDRSDKSISGDAPMLMIAINADRALPILLSTEYFTIENSEVHYIIRAINEWGYRIPHDKLLPFIEQIRPLIGDYPHHYGYAEALKAYALNLDSSTKQLLLDELHSTNKTVREGAAEGLAALNDVLDPASVVFNIIDEHGFDALTSHQKIYFAVQMYDSEVNNGGHEQYFSNSSGDTWKIAIRGLKAIGASERENILRKAVQLFGFSKPSLNREKRMDQLERLSEQRYESLSQLDAQYYACDENIEVMLSLYASKYKNDFKL